MIVIKFHACLFKIFLSRKFNTALTKLTSKSFYVLLVVLCVSSCHENIAQLLLNGAVFLFVCFNISLSLSLSLSLSHSFKELKNTYVTERS